MINVTLYPKIYVQGFHPLTPKTESTLQKYIFQGQEPIGGCRSLQAYAKKVDTAQTLLSQHLRGEIDLSQERKRAVANCLAFLPLLLYPVGATIIASGLKDPGLLILSLLVSAVCIPVFAEKCSDALKIFQKPSLGQLVEELAYDRPAAEDIENVGVVLSMLQDLERNCNQEIATAEENGDLQLLAKLNESRVAIQSAHADLSKLLAAFKNRAEHVQLPFEMTVNL